MARTRRKTGETIDTQVMVADVYKEIEDNYRDANLSKIAKKYDVSLAYVSECVRVESGKTFKQLLQKKRMDVAAQKLRKTKWTIKRIIDDIGYENTSYFYQVFRAHFGMNPSEYRKMPLKPGRKPKDK